MAKALFVVPYVNSNPQVDMALVQGVNPPNGYGYSCVGHVPAAPTCLVLIESSDATLDTLAAHPDYLFVEDVA